MNVGNALSKAAVYVGMWTPSDANGRVRRRGCLKCGSRIGSMGVDSLRNAWFDSSCFWVVIARIN